MTNHDLDFVGVPSTILSWMAFFELVSISPVLNVGVSLMSIAWLSMQMYGWIEKRVKGKKHGKE